MWNWIKRIGRSVGNWFRNNAGNLVSAGASLYGGRESQQASERMAREQMEAQKEFAQHGVRWRVEDAKAAGLHPLYALGGQLPSYSPVQVMDSMGPAIADAGQHIGRAIGAGSTRLERMMTDLSIRKMESEIAETDARRELALSEAARNRQFANDSLGFPAVNAGEETSFHTNPYRAAHTMDESRLRGIVKADIPTQVVSSGGDIATVAGEPPLWRVFHVGEGRKIALPHAENAAEALEPILEGGTMALWAIYRENVARYGDEWGEWFMKRYGSELPSDTREWFRRQWDLMKQKYGAMYGR